MGFLPSPLHSVIGALSWLPSERDLSLGDLVAFCHTQMIHNPFWLSEIISKVTSLAMFTEVESEVT